jgi:hypothetical protein
MAEDKDKDHAESKLFNCTIVVEHLPKTFDHLLLLSVHFYESDEPGNLD